MKGPIVFIACSKTKRSQATQARDLYCGTLFKKTLKYAEQKYSSIFILSAKYGVVSLNQIIPPYEKTLSKMSKTKRNEWYSLVKKQMKDLQLKPPYIFLTGKLYNQNFIGDKPLSNLSLGQQLQWFNKKLLFNKKKGFEL